MSQQTMDAALYDLTQNTQGQLFMAMQKHFTETLPPLAPILQIRRGYAESPAWFMVQAAEFAPEPLTIHNIRVRDIYASERIVSSLLELLAGERWLERKEENYYLTSTGEELIAQLQSRTAKVLTCAELPISPQLIKNVESSLRKIIDKSLVQSDAALTWCLRYSRNRAPEDDAHPFIKLSQYFSDFNAYRDDAHMRAWQPYEPEGYIWEAFAHIASKKATNSDAIFDGLFYRGYSKEEFKHGLERLEEKDWIVANYQDTEFGATERGNYIFKAVEEKTDELFYAPWLTFSADFQIQTIQNLQQFHDELQAIAAKE